ncbi:hypothetical protein CHAB381_0532 [Campylobacter hominis ATCC BAA-381]|uniref:Uncharacterized protein n=1 Tax=Campylobacter hominis (strain ATCC BAA-381 / DSM 21671 / CCUG 45161 / LMG 19568 / NCTC 13146 / CH001A) TaxID=360107 RepID=A7I0S9_CAMHC|nr:hypothetical protein CHAB381_0532 [Campylobacter hominis ATCC BAA-381]
MLFCRCLKFEFKLKNIFMQNRKFNLKLLFIQVYLIKFNCLK